MEEQKLPIPPPSNPPIMDLEQQGYETEDEDEKKYTPGKLLRKLKQLRRPEKHEIINPLPKDQQDYLDWFKQQGGAFDKLTFAKFYLKNGLPYPGLVATEQIQCNQDIIRAPVNILLTTRDAISIPELFPIYQKYPRFFHQDYQSQWEDHVQAIFFLYEYQKREKSKWWNVINNLPKDQDYIIFWNQQELQQLEDNTFINLINKSRLEVEEKYKIVKHILEQYPQLFTKESYSWQNFKWVYSHLVTRCFGKYLCYVTMVPLAEYLNHECIDVYYDFAYNSTNPAKPETNYDTNTKVLTEKEIEEMTSSDESYGSEDSETDNEIEYEEEFSNSYSNQAKVNERIKKQEISLKDTINPDTKLIISDKNQQFENQSFIKNQINNMHLWLYGNLDFGDNYQIFYAGLIYKSLEKLQEEFLSKEISYISAKNQLFHIKQLNDKFLQEIIKFIKITINPDIKSQQLTQVQIRPNPLNNKENNKEKPLEQLITQFNLNGEEEDESMKNKFEPIENWSTDKFDYFVMRTSRKDQFEKGSQVYFCYGRLSNRLLLMRYGITLEWNKYNHYYLRMPYFQILNNQERFSLTALNHVKTVYISKYKRFKLKLVKFNFEILVFMKLAYLFELGIHDIDDIFYIKNFYFELKGLQILLNYYENLEKSFKYSIEENEKMLYDQSISYSQYFIIIYRLEKQRIVNNQLNLTKILIEIMKRAIKNQKQTFSQEIKAIVPEFETYEQYRRNRIQMKGYFATLHPSVKK